MKSSASEPGLKEEKEKKDLILVYQKLVTQNEKLEND